jgi:hypothetical protein
MLLWRTIEEVLTIEAFDWQFVTQRLLVALS